MSLADDQALETLAEQTAIPPLELVRYTNRRYAGSRSRSRYWRMRRRLAVDKALAAGHTLTEVGEALGLSRQRVAQIAGDK